MNYLDKTGLTYVWSKLKAKLGLKQDTLVSGTNIKTINNNSILGAGNLNLNVDYIFEWDGQSNTDNADNLTLWQTIYEKQKEKSCIVLVNYLHPESFQERQWSILFHIQKNTLTNTTSTQESKLIYSYVNTLDNSIGNSYTEYKQARYLAIMQVINDQVSLIGGITTIFNTGFKGLETDKNYSTPYTPLYNGSPATKKYVDDSIVEEVFIGDIEDAPEDAKIVIDDDGVDMFSSEVVNSLAGDETAKAPSVHAVNEILGNIETILTTLTTGGGVS